MPKDNDLFFSAWFYSNSKDKFGEERVDRFLRKSSEKRPVVQAYFNKTQDWNKHLYEKPPVPTLDEVIAVTPSKGFGGRMLSIRFCRNADSDDLEKLLKAAMAEPDLSRRSDLLWGLRQATAQISEKAISELLQSENEDIRETAFDIMGNHPSPKTREFALSLLKNGTDTVNALSLLSKNMLPRHEQILNDAVKSIPVKLDEADWHSAFMAVVDAIKNMRGKPKTDLLYYIYSETYCGTCRESIVRLIHKKRLTTDSFLQEWRYDSNDDIRAFAQRILRGRKREL